MLEELCKELREGSERGGELSGGEDFEGEGVEKLGVVTGKLVLVNKICTIAHNLESNAENSKGKKESEKTETLLEPLRPHLETLAKSTLFYVYPQAEKILLLLRPLGCFTNFFFIFNYLSSLLFMGQIN
jgi:hypothetical protein